MASITISGSGNIVVTQNSEGLFINGLKQDIGSEINVTLVVQGNLNGSLKIDNGSVKVDGDVLEGIDSVNTDIVCNDIAMSVQTVNGDVSANTISGSVKTINGDISSGRD